jgi:putative hemolysin
MFSELLIVMALILANGVFAMSEISLVSSRKARLRQLAEEGDARAKAALELAESPTRFLSTVQIGISLIGIFAGAYAGDSMADKLAVHLDKIPLLQPYSHGVALALVVILIAYLSLVFGELVPKRIGMQNPETIARFMARPMNRISHVAKPLVWFLSHSTDFVLRVMGIKPGDNQKVTEDEVRGVFMEGLSSGALDKGETELLESVLEMDKLSVRELMTPRPKMIWLGAGDPHDLVWHKIVVSGHTSFPVYEGNRDHVIGVVSVKSIYANLAAGAPVDLKELMTPPLIVPETQNARQLLDTFKNTGKHIALVSDEFGNIVGLVTLHDAMEALIGDFSAVDQRRRFSAKKREDGSWLVDAMIEIERLEDQMPGISFTDEEHRSEYQTLAGYIVKKLGRVPVEGETFEAMGYVFEILDMDRHRVDKVLIMPVKATPAATAASV